MSTQTEQSPTDSPTDVTSSDEVDSVEELTAQLKLLREENRRLRTRYARTRRTEYRRAALGVAGVGIAAALGAVVFSNSRTVLFALAGIGVFTGVLTYYLTPERFVAASVGERTYAALATLGQELIAELGLQETRIYVPTGGSADNETAAVRLFVPEHVDYVVPNREALQSLFVVTDDERAHGVAITPTGATLFSEFTRTMTDSLAEAPTDIADQVTEALVDGFELAESAVADVDPENAQATVGISGSTFGDVGRFNHPITSFIATGLAVGLQQPVRVDAITTDDDRFDYILTYTWDDAPATAP